MQIISGCFEHGVMQRGKIITVNGRSEAATGKVLAVVAKDTRKIAQATAPIRQQQFSIGFKNLPAGGPYTVTFTTDTERLVVKDVLVGDVWILAGQSNMQGLGYLRHAEKPHAAVRAFYMDDHWAVAIDPLHRYGHCTDEVHGLLSGGETWPKPLEGVGPGLGFALEMQRQTGIPQGLISCAHGGSSLAQWSPEGISQGSKTLYGATMRRVTKNGGRVAGILWSQGESEAGSAEDAKTYHAGTVALMKGFRRDLRDARLPVVMTQIGRVAPARGTGYWWNFIQDQQRQLPKLIPHLAVVPTVDLPFEDDAHIGGDGNLRVGRRMANAMQLIRTGKGHPQITLKRARVVEDPLSWWGGSNIVVEFDNVVGKLVSAGRPMGFAIGNPSIVYAIDLDGNKAIVRVALAPLEVTTQTLQYGQGTNPFCNITDEAGRSLPVFGPYPLGQERALTAFAKPKISQVLPGAGKLHELMCPTDDAGLNWHAKQFRHDFCDVHNEFTAFGPTDKLIYFSCELDVPEPMKLVALLGYDGPVKLWIDTHEYFHDPNGTNPGIIDSKCIRYNAPPGRHRVIVALDSNGGKAWGIYLRFQREDATVKKGRLPELV